MDPIRFEEVTNIYGENQEGVIVMPVFVNKELGGHVISCWKPTLLERLRILFKGELWLSIVMQGQPLPPVILTTKKTDVLSVVPQEEVKVNIKAK